MTYFHRLQVLKLFFPLEKFPLAPEPFDNGLGPS